LAANGLSEVLKKSWNFSIHSVADGRFRVDATPAKKGRSAGKAERREKRGRWDRVRFVRAGYQSGQRCQR